ncbi:lysozyme family protein [Ectobacillus antri]|jgi:hypothetical protein|uniref:Lysozyme family protein n=1 Tax=Ectobacillus antri TaxID=2486280 RepID=A0ABT6H875_9BACI|nr:lysozyme family protein [Ectobacillus antri]MDG4657333.1 lysozyme family protein [Ectobacillus antri]MDG5754536.1 lysozyme family protein [Ectobacillus antri]
MLRRLLFSLLMLLSFPFILLLAKPDIKHKLNDYFTTFLPSHTDKVLTYETDIKNELTKYNLSEFTPLLLAIMYQESKGEGLDPMQSSESAGLKRNAIQNPQQSISQGVFHFQHMYKLGQKHHVDLSTIVQSYNMGPGYIMYIAGNGTQHTQELAKAYSKMQVDNRPDLYTCGGSMANFRYPYCFGDFSYADKVQKHMTVLEKQLRSKESRTASVK